MQIEGLRGTGIKFFRYKGCTVNTSYETMYCIIHRLPDSTIIIFNRNTYSSFRTKFHFRVQNLGVAFRLFDHIFSKISENSGFFVNFGVKYPGFGRFIFSILWSRGRAPRPTTPTPQKRKNDTHKAGVFKPQILQKKKLFQNLWNNAAKKAQRHHQNLN